MLSIVSAQPIGSIATMPIGAMPPVFSISQTRAISLMRPRLMQDLTHRPFGNESGQTVVLAAMFMGVVAMGFVALALDVGYLFHQKRMIQSAADAAAVAAAEEVGAGYSSNEQNVAEAVAKLNGFDTTLAQNPAVVTFPTPSGTFTGSSYVAVTVSKPVRTFFMGTLLSRLATQTVSATAVAGGGQLSQTCVCLEGTSGQTLLMNGASRLTANSCGIVDNSADSTGIGVTGGSSLSATSIGFVSSTWSQSSSVTGGSSLTGKVVEGTNKCSPTLPPAPTHAACLADPGGNFGIYTWGPATSSGTICYTSLTVGANASMCTLNPGIYVITGTLHFESGIGGHSNFGGNGVLFYLAGTANLVIDNGANINLVAGGSTLQAGGTAPTLGVYNGIAIYQASGDVSAMTIQGGSSSYISGAIYAPSAALSVGNGSSMTVPIGGIVANSLSLTSGASLNVEAGTNQGSVTIGSPKLVQ
jgi:hypothetical protein